jgi:uncharacterized protein (TIGR03083 family)
VETARYRECLDTDFRRMREVAARDLTRRVPSCPDWDVAELVRHTSAVYLHKVMGMEGGAEPDEWPPPGINEEEPIALFDRAYAALGAQFDRRDPADATGTWYDPDQTVGFWIRRMAQETVIHRVDAELALGEPIAPIPDDLAVDGIDEVLVTFLSFASVKWASEFPGLDRTDGRSVRVEAGTAAWNVRLTPEGIVVGEANGADAGITGTPHEVLLWLWRRTDEDAVSTSGDVSLVSQLRELLFVATQ